MKHDLSEPVRDAGYEALFLLGGFLGFSVHPTQRTMERILQWIDESQSRRQQLKRLRERGLIESGPGDGGEKRVTRLTDLGHASFAGGRHPEPAWNRGWDGKWRLLTFDLPRRKSELRMRLRRWLCANYFGRLQGSVWISPDPVRSLAKVTAGEGVDGSQILVFEGEVAGKKEPRAVAETAWDFAAIDAGYRRYGEFAARSLQTLESKPPAMGQLQKLLREDRKQWWEAVRRDPLLPKALHPKGYQGCGAWKVRGKFLKRLAKTLGGTLGAT